MIKNYICDNKIFHSRIKPFKNHFEYNVLSIIFNINSLNIFKKIPIFSINKFNIFSIFLKDYAISSDDLYKSIISLIKKKFKTKKKLNIYLLTSPRFFGYVFNPISIFFAFNKKKLNYIIYEVRNTHQEKHLYIKKIKSQKKVIFHTIPKKFYVSPFLKMNMKYYFKIVFKKKFLNVKIDAKSKNNLLLTGMNIKFYDFNSKNLIFFGLKRLFSAQKTILLIHYQAIKILLKKAKFYFKLKNKKINLSYS